MSKQSFLDTLKTTTESTTSTLITTTPSLYRQYRRKIKLRSLLATLTTTTLLPSQCSSYTLNNDATRNVNYNATFDCDSVTFGTGRWVRFVSPAGTFIPITVPSTYTCGTHSPGWYNGTYPTVAGSANTGDVCFNWLGNSCCWSTSIQVTNCLTYYVFFLSSPITCQLRYCTMWFDRYLSSSLRLGIQDSKNKRLWSRSGRNGKFFSNNVPEAYHLYVHRISYVSEMTNVIDV